MAHMRALTASEVAALTGLDERRVRKDLEQGIFGVAKSPRFSFAALVYFRAMMLLGLRLPTEDRKRLYRLITDALDAERPSVDIGPVAALNVGAVRKDVADKLDRFTVWKRKLVVDDAILAGEPVFPGSRLAVRHIGAMLLRGAVRGELCEDYPYLTDDDLEFAPLFAIAYPRVGRPRSES